MGGGRIGSFIRGAALGAGLCYLFDPVQGNRRRARLRDRADHAVTVTDRFMEGALLDLNNRAHGLMCEARSWFDFTPPSDEVLVERVRAKLGRVTSHPRAIEVAASRGSIALSGPILSHEMERVLTAVEGVRGVLGVQNRLKAHASAGSISELQGAARSPEPLPEYFQERWTDGPRLLAMVAGGLMALFGARRGGLTGVAAGAAGIGLTVRAAANRGLGRAAGMETGHRTVDVQKTINIDAPVEKVFQAFSDCRFFPYFLANVEDVHDLGHERSHWIVNGPAGAKLEWDAERTTLEPGREIGWRTIGSAPVEHEGIIQFRPHGEKGTQVQIRLSYSPPGGVVGHTAARVFGADPKSLLDADLARMKTFIETGTPAHDAARSQPLAA